MHPGLFFVQKFCTNTNVEISQTKSSAIVTLAVEKNELASYLHYNLEFIHATSKAPCHTTTIGNICTTGMLTLN